MDANYHHTRPVARDKAEHDLALNIKKATSPEETAPKQKHVRSCIVYTWDYHTSQSIWTGLKVQPILADEVQTFKALIAVHKIIRGGHPVTIKEAQNETAWLETCAKSVMGDGFRGYGSLIRSYVSFLQSKLHYHRMHPEFNGNFDYEDYISLKGVDDPNEGYETISDLMNLQDQIDKFQKQIIAHFRPSSNNETRMAALVPLVEESYGIYTFMTNMLRAMHRRTDAIDALEPLRSRFNAQHYALRKFYTECANLQYLTRLISVPKLPQDPPSLIDGTAPALPKRQPQTKPPTQKPQSSSEPDALTEFWKNEDEAQKAEQQRLAYEEQQRQLQAAHEAKLNAMRMMELQRQRDLEEQQRVQEERGRLAQEQLMREQLQRHAEGRVVELEREILGLKGQVDRDQMMLAQYDGRVKALENEMAQLNLNAQQRFQSKDDMIKSLQDEIQMWRKKYEALAKLYSQLRQEHLETLNKLKQLQLKANSAQEAIDKMERMEREMRSKNLELADMIRERDRVRHELDRLKASQRDELERLRRDVTAAEARADELSRSKADEISALMAKYNREKQELEDTVKAKQAYVDDVLRRFEEQKREIQTKDEELLITQASMDQALLELAEARNSTLNQADSEQSLQLALDTLILDHMKGLNEILDSMFQTCIQKIDDSLYELESPMQAGNQNSTPEYTLSMIEKANAQTSEFSFAFQKFLKEGRSKGHNEVIKTATMFAYAVSDVLVNAKGITRLADKDETSEDIVRVGKEAAKLAQNFLESLKSYKLNAVHDSKQAHVVLKGDMDVQESLQKLSTIAAGLVKHAINVSSKADGEIGDLVEKEMLNAAKVINNAVERLQALMSRPPDAGLSATELKVHDSILGCALAVTNAIAHLIKCATESQQEIVVKGRGTSSHAAFYKKHNRWTEGLISAAKAIAMATNLLIETADGVIHGNKSLEQLIVASNEVAAATAQLVAASRVKADFMSKTQDRLETASKAVTDACKALVKAVKDIAARQLEENDVGSDYYASLTPHDFKVAEMNQQVEILKLEKGLVDARRRLAVMRKVGYHAEEDT